MKINSKRINLGQILCKNKQLKRSVFLLVALVTLVSSGRTLLHAPTVSAATNYACGGKADLWFANDESGSVDAGEFKNALDFMYQISDKFQYDSDTGMQAGVFGWGKKSTDVVMPITQDFGDPGDSGLFQDNNIVTDGDHSGIRELYSARTGVQTATDLTEATGHMADLINGGNGRRDGVRQVAIFLTDAMQSQLTGDAANWEAQADSLRASNGGNIGVVIVLIGEAASAYNNDTSAKATVDTVVGTHGLVITVPTYAEAANSSAGFVDQVANSICRAITPVDDHDSIPATVENDGPNNGDGNSDGIPDSKQSNVTTDVDPTIDAYTTTSVSGDCTSIKQLEFFKESQLAKQDPNYNYPLGLHGFKVNCGVVGGTVHVKYYWNKLYDTSQWNYRKYINGKYIDFNSQVTYGTALVGGHKVTTVSYSVKDGGPYDDDGVANGVIIDPSGPTVLGISSPNTGFGQPPNNISAISLIGTGTTGLVFAFRLSRKKQS